MANETKKLSRGKFTFIGEPVLAKEPVQKLERGTDWILNRLNFGIKVGTNTQFLTTEFMLKKGETKVRLYDNDGEAFDILPEQGADPRVLAKLPDYKKIILDIEDDFEKKEEYTKLYFKIRNIEMRDEKSEADLEKLEEYKKEFAEKATRRKEIGHVGALFGAIPQVVEIAKQKGCYIKVTGTIKSNYYKDENRLQYTPSTIEFVPKDSDKPSDKPRLEIQTDFFYNKDTFTDFTDEKQIALSGYLGETAKGENHLYPTNVVFDYSNVNFEDEKQVAYVDLFREILNTASDDGIYRLGLILKVINGAEEKELTLDDLEDLERKFVLAGLKTMDDIKKARGTTFGANKQQLKLINVKTKDLQTGAVKTFELEELEELLPKDDSDVKEKDVKKKSETKELSEEEAEAQTSNMLDGLFG